jgi:hypothetical protein
MIKLELEVAEVNLVLLALADRPLKEVADLFQKVQGTANAQMMEKQQAEKKEKEHVANVDTSASKSDKRSK